MIYIIGGTYKSRRLTAPKGSATRPTAGRCREAVFNICQNNISGARFLDLFAGSGAMGLEALSRGALSSTMVEKNAESCRCIRKNIDCLGFTKQATLHCGDVFATVSKLCRQQKEFEIIFADPPYSKGNQGDETFLPLSDKIAQLIDNLPLLVVGGILIIEEKFNTPLTVASLHSLTLIKSRRLGDTILQILKKN